MKNKIVVHHLESDWDFLLERAKRYGRNVYEWDGTVYVRNEVTVSKEDIVLEFRKSIISFRARESLAAQISKCTYTGWNMTKCEGVTGSATLDEVPVKVGGNRSWADEARILPGKWESVIDSQGVKDAEEARDRALGELQNASMEWQRAEVRCEGLCQAHPGMRVTLKYVGERFSGEYVIERVNHEFDVNGFMTELHLRRNMLLGETKRTSAIDEERGQQHNGGNDTGEDKTRMFLVKQEPVENYSEKKLSNSRKQELDKQLENISNRNLTTLVINIPPNKKVSYREDPVEYHCNINKAGNVINIENQYEYDYILRRMPNKILDLVITGAHGNGTKLGKINPCGTKYDTCLNLSINIYLPDCYMGSEILMAGYLKYFGKEATIYARNYATGEQGVAKFVENVTTQSEQYDSSRIKADFNKYVRKSKQL